MTRLPTEILSLIFSDVCTDGGYTGRSLSLVSKHFHDISREHALHSVVLYGSHQISSFAALLERTLPGKRRIRHLFITDVRRRWLEPSSRQERWRNWNATSFGFDALCANEMLRILNLVSPHLRALTVLLFKQYDADLISIMSSCPLLEELTVHSWTLLNTFPLLDPERRPECLSLRRLHVIVKDFKRSWNVPLTIALFSPRITHLRFSRLPSSFVPSLVRGLERLLVPQDDLTIETRNLNDFPRTLTRVILHMCQPELRDASGEIQFLMTPDERQLYDIAMRDAQRRIVLLKPLLWETWRSSMEEKELAPHLHYYAEIRRAWEERIVGLEGIWAFKQSDVLASYRYLGVKPLPTSV